MNYPSTKDFETLFREDFSLINRRQEDKQIQMTNKKAYKTNKQGYHRSSLQLSNREEKKNNPR